MSAANLLDRLDKVKATGSDRWMACCPAPAHEDKNPSLSIREVEAGRVLLHCFGGGCDVESILDAVGLTFADIMPERIDRHSYPSVKPNHWHAARDALSVLSTESLIVALAGENIANGIALSGDDRNRVLLAANRIRAAQGATQ